MPPFTYAYTPSTAATTIGQLLAQGGQTAANAVTAAALAQGTGQTDAANAYAQGLNKIGQLPSQYLQLLKLRQDLQHAQAQAALLPFPIGGSATGSALSGYAYANPAVNPLMGYAGPTALMDPVSAALSNYAAASPALSLPWLSY